MSRTLIWYYRKLIAALAYIKWVLFKQQPDYLEGSRVIARLTSTLYGTEEVLCRISSISYRFYSLTYNVIVLENKGWLAFGTKTFVFPENILGTSRHTD